MFFRTLTLSAVLTLVSISVAQAYCAEPQRPFTNVTKPFCAGIGGDMSDCSNWDIQNYRQEVERHIQAMENYAEEAVRFAECEIDEAIREWNEFARRF